MTATSCQWMEVMTRSVTRRLSAVIPIDVCGMLLSRTRDAEPQRCRLSVGGQSAVASLLSPAIFDARYPRPIAILRPPSSSTSPYVYMPTALNTQFDVKTRDFIAGSSSSSSDGPTCKPQLPRITTFGGDDGSEHYAGLGGRYPSFGAVVGSLDVDVEPLILSPHMLVVDRSHPVAIKAASAPDATDAFPAYLRLEDPEPKDTFVASPAQMFLSAFSPPSSSKAETPDADGLQVAGYTLSSTIGFGGFSTIKKAFSSTGDVVAIKVVKRSDIERQDNPEETRRHMDNELEIWSILRHEHIMPLFTSVRTLYADYFVTLYCPAGSLFDILKRDGRPALPQDDAGMMFRQIVRGLRYLHEVAKLVHGDIKLENVFVDEMGSCRIGDFGLSKHIHESSFDEEYQCECESETDSHGDSDGDSSHPVLRHERIRRRNTEFVSHVSRPAFHLSLRRSRGPSRHRNSTPFPTDFNGNPPSNHSSHPLHQFASGSLPYASPELLSPPAIPRTSTCKIHGTPFAPNPAQDMWALGVLLYALLTGRLPFSDSFEPRLQMKILHGAYDVPAGIGHGAESVLRGCLERAVPLRWTINMVDDIAWGVGWGIAGDVSGPPSASPIENDHPGLHHFADDYRRERSLSRARPYPDTHEHNSHLNYYHHHSHPSDAMSSALSSSSSDSSSKSRSCSRSARRVRGSRERSPSRSSIRDSVITEDVAVACPPFSSQMLPPPIPMRRGRRSRKSTVEGAHLTSLSPSDDFEPLSNSRSRSISPTEAPTTPPDMVPRPFSFPFHGDHAATATTNLGAAQRGHGQGSRVRRSKPDDDENSSGAPLDVVEEREGEPPTAGRWSPSSVLDVPSLSLHE